MLQVAKTLSARPLGLVFDIDGTLSPIAPTPGEARLYPGVADLLTEARAYAHIAIVTGRSIESGAAMVNIEGLTYIGIHGVEWCEGLPSTHTIQINPAALPYIDLGEQMLALAEQKLAGLPGVIVERKRLGGSVHYRLAPEPEHTRELILDILQEPARSLNFLLSEGKRVIDLKPALQLNKGTALRSLAQRFQFAGVIFAGDDRTDLDAVLEIERLRQDGLLGTSIAVAATDTLADLLEHADIVVQGVESMARLLSEMVEQLRDQYHPLA